MLAVVETEVGFVDTFWKQIDDLTEECNIRDFPGIRTRMSTGTIYVPVIPKKSKIIQHPESRHFSQQQQQVPSSFDCININIYIYI